MIKGALGLNDDKSVTGQPLIAIADSDYVYRDDEKCSKSCFWLKSNRVTELPDWSDEDTQLFLTLLPAYMSNRRGACIIALAVENLCAEVCDCILYHERMLIPGRSILRCWKLQRRPLR